ncbi:hypothetical protein Slin15195_G060110 [Septoria linicola]|uniref:Zn(2)-C6 fungal-type domain-containing protein n=1 Tax=Septoria linicola TaxID=215465 RepID=A0A9Q9AVG7_9PEZI|nr:hypothetical protein Slin15195_G060110 [Septoria linicola]
MDDQSSSTYRTQSASRLVPLAPAAALPVSQNGSSNGVELMPWSCTICAKRKVKCDKLPGKCSACRKGRLDCQYQEPAPRKRKRKPVEDLQDRLDRYEKLLHAHGILAKEEDVSPDASEASTAKQRGPSMGEMGATAPGLKTTGRLIQAPSTFAQGTGKTRYVDSNIWRNLADHMGLSDGGDDDYDEQDDNRGSAEPIDPASAAFFGPSTPSQSLLDIHPTYDVAMKLWKLYVRNVDPICKLVHVPTGKRVVERAATNPSGIDRITECLLFAIYHFAVASTSEQECYETFGQTWASMQKRYHNATRQALVAAHFLRTTELPVLQAFVLFLLPMRNRYDPHTFWVLTGIAVRLGQRMGLHRDGEEMGLNPFDVQMRRRVFWQLLPLDGMSGQLSGTGIAITADSWDTKQPLNINDEDIWPGMDRPPVERHGATDMIFCLARTEIGKFHQKVKPQLGLWAKFWEAKDLPAIHNALSEVERTMEEKYIRYCDFGIPIHCLAMAMARGALQSGRLRVKLGSAKNNGATPDERREIYTLASKILDLDLAVHENAALNRFDWHMKSFFQWDPLIWMLNEVIREDTILDRDEVWAKTAHIYKCHPELIAGKKSDLSHPELNPGHRSIDIALGRLTVKSWDAMKQFSPGILEPSFITELREVVTRKDASRHSSIARTPGVPVNVAGVPSQPEIPLSNYINVNIPWGFASYGALNDVNDDLDWRFWDQMIQEPAAFPSI